MSAQFFSSLADNALLVGAIELLKTSGAPAWQIPALTPMFALFYVILAPLVGAFADAVPKGKVMLYSNGIKAIGCLMMLFGSHPLLAYAVVGLGAASYSPAKYGILTELLPPSQLVKANGWIEGLTIASIILGVLLGGQLVGPRLAPILLGFDLPLIDTGVDTPAEAAIATIISLYLIAAMFNLRIPRTEAPLQPLSVNALELIRDFGHCNTRLWKDKLGQISLATTTLFWGSRAICASSCSPGPPRPWATAPPRPPAWWAWWRWARPPARWSPRSSCGWTAPPGAAAGHRHGPAGGGLNLVHHAWLAVPFLIVLGALGGYLVVPMNALLQHRGHNLMGAGRSIAVQNFNEQTCILALGAVYTGMTRVGLTAFTAIAVFGLGVAGLMWLIRRWHQRNCVVHRTEVDRLLAIARSDCH
jgi:MFS family permease